MRARPFRRVMLALAAILVLAGAVPRGAGDLPGCDAPAGEVGDALETAEAQGAACTIADERAIEAQSVCVGSTVHSAGELGPALLYRGARLPDGRLEVGYYAFFSEERPWGNNWLTWSLVPALVLDLVYTRGLLVAPGLQRAAYGPADVEGFRVIYAVDEAGRLRAESAVADDETHRRADLSHADLFAADPGRITVATSSWSHHLGAHLRGLDDLVYRRCYGPEAIRPLDRAVVRRFNLERRAGPARTEGG